MSVLLDISRSSPGPPEMESEIEIAFTFGESSHRNNRFLSLRAALKSIIPNMGNLVSAIKRCLSVARAVAQCKRSLRANIVVKAPRKAQTTFFTHLTH